MSNYPLKKNFEQLNLTTEEDLWIILLNTIDQLILEQNVRDKAFFWLLKNSKLLDLFLS